MKKHLTSQAIQSLCSKFGINHPDKFTQDWELESCDPARVDEWLTGYENTVLSEEEKNAFMAIILSSLDEAVEDGIAPPYLRQRISNILQKEGYLHQDLIHYWCAWNDEGDSDNTFAISPLMRALKLSAPEDTLE